MNPASASRTIPITRPNIGPEELEAVAAVLRSGWLVQGEQVRRFETLLSESSGVPHAIAVSSCTAALHLSLVACGIGPGDEVLVPALTYVATANAVEQTGARPVFVDIRLDSWNIDPDAWEARITSKTRAVIPVHLFGRMAPMDRLMPWAERRNLRVIEDAACAIGARSGSRAAGSFGTSGCFSFHPRKVITTGEGGAIVTADGTLAERLRQLRSHGESRSDWSRHGDQSARLPQFGLAGYNYRMTDFQAALGAVQMKRLPALLEARLRLARRYAEGLRGVPGLETPAIPEGEVHPFQSYVIRITPAARCSRDELAEQLKGEGIATRQGTHAVHALDYYARKYGFRPEDFPNAWTADQESLTLPLYPALSAADQDQVIETIRKELSAR
ncbi:MAG: hypothetical protein COV76_01600 [Candidatus Omnitrophica bacterium CG11_big_fil_rev_8_21_14_0_20_64_10]|nr:MAG: hypothetical protein COV76_01600 [Candidatus Omnitrophica bacterium CG11_big_fil_rev_8_21_14_0_20_64_10]